MTREGYKTILVRKEIYDQIKKIAQKEGISITKATSKIVTEFLIKNKKIPS